jgi:hypothetical protein
MEPPAYSSAHQGSNPQGDELVFKFHKSRKTAKKCGKVIMYIGYILMVLNSIDIFFQISRLLYTGKPENISTFIPENALSKPQLIFGQILTICKDFFNWY